MTPLLATGIAVFAAAIAAAYMLIEPIIRASVRTGYVDIPEGRKDHPRATPYGGGFVVLSAVALPALLGLGLALLPTTPEWVPAEVSIHFHGIRDRAPQIFALLGGAILLTVLGYVDDRKKLPVWPRLAAQVIAASLLVLADLKATAWIPSPIVAAIVTVFFVVLVTNAHNFIDNANGALGGVAAIEASGILVLAIGHGQWFVAAVALCLLGGLLVFLPANFPKPRLFMGDAGAFLVGFLLAGLTIMLRYDDGRAPWRALALPALLLLVPVIDGALVTLARLSRGVSPFTAGHDHLLHRIAVGVGSREKATMGLWTIAWIGVLVANACSGAPRSGADVAFLPVLAVIVWMRRRRGSVA